MRKHERENHARNARMQHATCTHAGAPGLLALQYVVDRLTPFTLAAALEQSLKETLRDVRSSQVRQAGGDNVCGRSAPSIPHLVGTILHPGSFDIPPGRRAG